MRAGTSRIDITPPVGVQMGGYLSRTKGAEDIHDPLYARALVLGDGERRVAIVTADLGALDVEVARAVREAMARETGIPVDHILLAFSHTHAGPLVARRRISEVAVSYQETLVDKLVEAVAAAAAELEPCRLGAGRAKLYLGINRRERSAGNRIVLGRNPKGFADPYSRVVVVAREDGGPMAVLFNYGAHPVVLGPDNLKISGDYAGLAERVVEQDYGDHAVALFLLGFAGDVNVNAENRTFGEVETIGSSLGRAVLEAIKTIDYATDWRLGARSVSVALPLEPPPPLIEAQRILFDERQRMSGLFGRGQEEAEIQRHRARVEWASDLVRLASEERDEYTIGLELQVLTMGPVALVGLAAEVFAEYANALDELSPFDHTVPISNANGNIGYLPTAVAFDEGGYEVDDAPRLRASLRFQPQVEAVVLDALRQILAEAGGVADAPEPSGEEPSEAADMPPGEPPPES